MNSTKFPPAMIWYAGLLLWLSACQATAGSHAADSRSRANTGAITACDVSAYVSDPDPKGLNVRSGPSSTYPIIGNLLYKEDDSDEGGPGGGIGVHITGASGDWVKIDRATEQKPDEEDRQPRTLFSGEGWVYGPLLTVDGVGGEGGTPIYEQPTKKSRLLMRMAPAGEGAEVRGCRGEWMYIEHQKVRGWAERKRLCDISWIPCN